MTPHTAPCWRAPVLIALGLLATGLHAQPAPTPTPPRAQPWQAHAPVPPARYDSPLSRYQAQRDIDVGSWREANDLTARIGGWRAYAREAHGTPAAPSAPSTPATPRAPDAKAVPTSPASSAQPGHGSHPSHGGQP
ncbi:hypothetical protein [Aquabacterium sp.]|uniref:hypothetical protein n=1 Tax=Aquabacterium sp. TaxID=1872578 RepID=UPI003BB21B2C